MNIQDQFDRDEAEIVEAYNRGVFSLSEYNKQIRELHREYRFMANEAAAEAHDRELERW